MRYLIFLKIVSDVMKLQDLDDTYRRYLEHRGALGFDTSGKEVLVGLSLSESVEYVTVTNGSISCPLPGDYPDPQRLLELAERHEAARPQDIDSIYRLFELYG